MIQETGSLFAYVLRNTILTMYYKNGDYTCDKY